MLERPVNSKLVMMPSLQWVQLLILIPIKGAFELRSMKNTQMCLIRTMKIRQLAIGNREPLNWTNCIFYYYHISVEPVTKTNGFNV